ncbi:MAG TPA: hypothetical protein VMS17_23165 [Gemmataceae bacterium]|nr:hypothetical protein [Gemmataceae bacterium]
MPPILAESERSRNLRFLAKPSLWPTWPFLALMRRRPGCEPEYGVLYDAWRVSGKTGLSATVYLTNLFLLPAAEEELFALPHETFDSPEEIFDADWRVD